MKKFFTLIAAAAMTLSMSAETVIYSWESDGTVKETGGKATAKVDEARVNYQNTAKGTLYNTICLSGKKQTYPTSAYVNVALDQPLAAGDVISITAYRNKDQAGKDATVEIIFKEDAENSIATVDQFPNLNEGGENDDAPGTQTLFVPESAAGCTSFDMTRGKASTNIFITNLKITREGGSPDTPAEGETFGVLGNGAHTWGKSFDEYTMPFEFDATTKLATFKNFLGGSTTVEVRYEIADPNKDPDMNGTMFNSVPVSGLGEGDQNTGCTINDFTGDFIIKLNGVNFGKLENIKVWPGYNSQIEVTQIGEGADAKKVYSLKLKIGGDFYPWDAATSSWGVKAAYPDFIEFTKIIPFENGGTSAIEGIGVDNSNAPVEYFNIQGVRINEPAAGQIVIRRQGTEVKKIFVR